MRKIYHALTQNLHQPPGNLQWLLDNNEWEAKEILWALDRMPRALWGVRDFLRGFFALSVGTDSRHDALRPRCCE